jgi:hypothetical protein
VRYPRTVHEGGDTRIEEASAGSDFSGTAEGGEALRGELEKRVKSHELKLVDGIEAKTPNQAFVDGFNNALNLVLGDCEGMWGEFPIMRVSYDEERKKHPDVSDRMLSPDILLNHSERVDEWKRKWSGKP